MKLGSYVHCTKILPKLACQGQKSRSPETKTKKCCIFSGVVLWHAVLMRHFFRSGFPPVLCRWENQRLLSSCVYFVLYISFWLVNVCFCCIRFRFSLPSQEIGLENVSLGQPESTTEMTSQSVQLFLHKWPQSVLILYNGMRIPLLKNCHFPWGIWTPSNTWFPGPTWLLKPNGISISSAIFARLTSVTDLPTDHTTQLVTMGCIYVCSTAMRPNNNAFISISP